jgi:hypothetical protein
MGYHRNWFSRFIIAAAGRVWLCVGLVTILALNGSVALAWPLKKDETSSHVDRTQQSFQFTYPNGRGIDHDTLKCTRGGLALRPEALGELQLWSATGILWSFVSFRQWPTIIIAMSV